MKFTYLGAFLAFSSFLHAGEAIISGTGRIAVRPDYVSLTVNINSECYPTPSAASQAADKVAKKIFDFLKQNIDTTANSEEDVVTSGGYTQPFSRYTTNDSGTSKKVCLGTFQKQTSITMKSKSVNDFATLFDAIQERVYSEIEAPSKISEDSPITFATIEMPSTQLFHSTQRTKEKESRALAIEDAIEKFEAMFVQKCAITSYDIVEINEGNNYARPSSYEKASLSESAASEAAPIHFDAHWVNSAINVKFRFEGGHCDKKPCTSHCH